jgi:hypothetical protein
MRYSPFVLGALVMTGAIYFSCRTAPEAVRGGTRAEVVEAADVHRTGEHRGTEAMPAVAHQARTQQPPAPLAPYVEKALDWLAGAQQEDGGWGAGSHSRQDVRDARAVPTDPATTAVAAMALVRAGNGLDHGPYASTLQKATDYLLTTVEKSVVEGPQITEQRGTQPQAKMGQNVDTALCAQFFARLLEEPDLAADLKPRLQTALDKCLAKIERSQGDDGSWAAGGWAPVLQSAQMSTALELGQLAGRKVDEAKLAQARTYQKNLVSAPASVPDAVVDAGGYGAGVVGGVRTDAAAGVMLYASAANGRAVAAESRAAEDLVEAGKRDGRLPKDAEVDADSLTKLGVEAPRAEDMVQSFQMNAAAKVRAFDESVLSGFGNNGGEEFLSYQMKSEALAIDGGEEWSKWTSKMSERLAKVQNGDGSWSGHHCITSPAFCTATAISCLTADRDVVWLRKAAQLARK